MVFYVSPHKAERQIAEMILSWGDRKAALVREISKIYQEAIRGTLSEIQKHFETGIKGEMVLVVSGRSESVASDAWKARAKELLDEGFSVKTVTQEITEACSIPKNIVKEFLLKQK